jgi:2-(1,2-epoxy-1,2-dihydrophenyl)acetyl-CoA isomerase
VRAVGYEALHLDVRANVARITLDRPPANAVDGRMARDLFDASLECDRRPDVRAVLLTGRGRMFSAGGDLGAFAEAGDAVGALLKEITTHLHAAISRFVRADAPIVAAVNGAAGGGGLSLVAACDLVVAGASASFTSAFTRAGLSPDGSSTWFLPRKVGLARALELTLTNRTLSAEEAREWGLVTRVVADDDLDGEAAALAERLAAGPTRAFGETRRLLLTATGESLETQMEHEAQAIARTAASADGQEGITAFLAKRPTAFRGE